MNVLEHVDDDAGLLRSVIDTPAVGILVFIAVPAFAFLQSAHDVFQYHRRRYTRAMLQVTKKAAGLQEFWVRYFYAAILLISVPVQLLRRGMNPQTESDLRLVVTLIR
jgi:hypothetical protein